jgi:hypothetical protein
VWVGDRRYEIEVCYGNGKTIAGVKKLVLLELKDPIGGPRELVNLDLRVEDLTIYATEEDHKHGKPTKSIEMPPGKSFVAQLHITSKGEVVEMSSFPKIFGC